MCFIIKLAEIFCKSDLSYFNRAAVFYKFLFLLIFAVSCVVFLLILADNFNGSLLIFSEIFILFVEILAIDFDYLIFALTVIRGNFCEILLMEYGNLVLILDVISGYYLFILELIHNLGIFLFLVI